MIAFARYMHNWTHTHHKMNDAIDRTISAEMNIHRPGICISDEQQVNRMWNE